MTSERPAGDGGRHLNCPLCGELPDKAYGYQKYGWEEDDVYLPAAFADLVLVKDLKPHSYRELKIMQCPACQTYYRYRTDYEYLVNGSEDEQDLIRLTDEEAAQELG